MLSLANVSHAKQTTYTNFLTVPVPGRLQGVGVASGMNKHYFNIELDGHEIISADKGDICFHSSQQYGKGEGNHGISFDADFDNMDIKIKDGKSPASEPRFWCTFEIDGSHLSMTKDEFYEKWNDDEESDFDSIEDEGDRVYVQYYDEDGSELLRQYRGMKRRARIHLDSDTIRGSSDSISGAIHCTNWKGEPLEFDEGLLPLQIQFPGRSSQFEELSTNIEQEELGVVSFETTSSPAIERGPVTLLVSTQNPSWANYRAGFTFI